MQLNAIDLRGAGGSSGIAIRFVGDNNNILGSAMLGSGWTVTQPATQVNGAYGVLPLAGGKLQTTTSYANDAAAAAGGVAIGQLYRNGSVVQVRVA